MQIILPKRSKQFVVPQNLGIGSTPDPFQRIRVRPHMRVKERLGKQSQDVLG